MNFKGNRLKDIFASSVIVRFSKKCYDSMLSGFFGSMLTNYSERQKLFESGLFGSEKDRVGSYKDSFVSRFRRRAIVSYENSGILKGLSAARNWLLTCKMKFYGFFFMYFGICVFLMNLIKRFAFPVDMSSDMGWLLGTIFIIAAFPMLISGKSFIGAACESCIFSLIVFDVLGFSRASLKAVNENNSGSKRYFWAAVFGAILGCVSYKISPLFIVLGTAALAFGVMIYKSPEIGLQVAVFAAPFLSFLGSPSLLLAALIIYTFICMCIKIFLGKLMINFEISDMLVLIFMLVMLFGGIISCGGVASLKEASMYVCFMFVYFMIVTLIKDGIWLDRLGCALVSSGALTALYGLYQKFSGNLEKGTMDKEMFEDIGGRVTSTFENSNMLGVFLIMMIPFAISYVFRAKRLYLKLLSASSAAVMGVCLIYTWSRGAWLGLVLAAFVFVILYNHYILPVLLPAGLLGITLLWDKLGGSGVFGNLITRFSSIITMSDTSSVYRMGIWRGAINVAKDNLFTGIGVGSEAFRTVYIRFAESGIETAVHSHNLFLQILIETGIVGLAIFILAMVVCIKSGLEIVRRADKDSMREKAMCVASISALLAALLQGMTDYIWFNYRIFFFFWVIVAIISASARIGRKKAMPKNEY